jgi:hypothetical protein
MIGRRHDGIVVWHVDQVGPDRREKREVEFRLIEADDGMELRVAGVWHVLCKIIIMVIY